MSWWEAIVLGLVQGLAEFLPISSSGHLVLGQYLLGIDEADITFEVFVHFGTTLSILTVYWKRIIRILRDGLGALTSPGAWAEAIRPGKIERARGDDLTYAPPEASGGPVPSLRLILYVLITMVPTGLAFVFFEERLEAAFSDPRLVCGMLLVTGTLLLLTRFRPDPDGVFSPLKAFIVGIGQAAALIPGISRSGSTICTAIYQNVDRKEAADFSFLMLLPVVLGATALKVKDMLEVGAVVDVVPLALGTLAAFLSGIAAISVVVILVQRRALQYFAVYCYAVGILGLLLI